MVDPNRTSSSPRPDRLSHNGSDLLKNAETSPVVAVPIPEWPTDEHQLPVYEQKRRSCRKDARKRGVLRPAHARAEAASHIPEDERGDIVLVALSSEVGLPRADLAHFVQETGFPMSFAVMPKDMRARTIDRPLSVQHNAAQAVDVLSDGRSPCFPRCPRTASAPYPAPGPP